MYRSGLGSNNQDYLLAERGRIDDTHRMADDVLEAAYATRAEMNDQRGILYGSKGRMGGVLGRFFECSYSTVFIVRVFTNDI